MNRQFKHYATLVLLLAFSGYAVAGPIDDVIEDVINKGDTQWLGYEVPMIEKQGSPCCWSGKWNKWDESDRMCSLDRDHHSWGSIQISGRERHNSETLKVLARASNGKVDRLLVVADDCHVDTAGHTLVWLSEVSPKESLDFLAGLSRDAEEDVASRAISGIAFHREPAASGTLIDIDRASSDEDTRDAVLFWLGTARGEDGYRYLEEVVTKDPDPDIRERAIFALSESSAERASDTIVEVSRKDENGEVRGQALFWLAESGDERALDAIEHALANDPDEDVREQAVFALNELPKGEGLPRLKELARGHDDPQVRSQALFWLSQGGYAGAAEVILDVLNHEGNADVREEAVFAASQLPDEQAVAVLGELMRSHPDPEVRREAMFWLAQSDDPAALDALDDILNR